MSNLSRRRLVTSAAALPALTVPALANVIDHPDAELIRLGKEYTRLMPEFEAAAAEYNSLVGRAYGVAFDRFDALVPDGLGDRQKRNAILAECMRTAEKENGADLAIDKYGPLEKRFCGIETKIGGMPASTMEGLRVKLIVAISTNGELWDVPSRDLDWNKLTIRSLLESLCVVTGVEVPSENLEKKNAA